MKIYKQKSSTVVLALKVGLAVEAGVLGASYLLFKTLNESAEKRYQYRNHPYLLEFYYKIDETLGAGEKRRSDQEQWKKNYHSK